MEHRCPSCHAADSRGLLSLTQERVEGTGGQDLLTPRTNLQLLPLESQDLELAVLVLFQSLSALGLRSLQRVVVCVPSAQAVGGPVPVCRAPRKVLGGWLVIKASHPPCP